MIWFRFHAGRVTAWYPHSIASLSPLLGNPAFLPSSRVDATPSPRRLKPRDPIVCQGIDLFPGTCYSSPRLNIFPFSETMEFPTPQCPLRLPPTTLHHTQNWTPPQQQPRAPGISWTSIISSAATLSSNLSYELSCPLGASLPEAGVLFYIRKTVHGIRSSNYATVIGRRTRLELHISSYKYGSYLSLLVCLFLGLVGGSNPYIHSVPVPPKQLSLASLLSIKHHKIYHGRYPLLPFLCSNSTLALSLSSPTKKKPFVLEARLNWSVDKLYTKYQYPQKTVIPARFSTQ
ncbi:hypothetical protein GE21DRAFT_1092501 [Neurospora crassa]|nr:hypothetical protein GE21DRAFT_1092501 [Neurospora crassa]